MNIAPYYVTIADFADLGIGHACDPASFDDACDAYAGNKEHGIDCAVFRVEPPKGTAAGAMIDVTDDAIRCICKRFRQRSQEFPEWLEAA